MHAGSRKCFATWDKVDRFGSGEKIVQIHEYFKTFRMLSTSRNQ